MIGKETSNSSDGFVSPFTDVLCALWECGFQHGGQDRADITQYVTDKMNIATAAPYVPAARRASALLPSIGSRSRSPAPEVTLLAHAAELLPSRVEVISIPTRYVGLVIGKEGTTISSISMDSGAVVRVLDHKSLEVNSRISIQGTPTQIAMAKTLIDQRLPRDQRLPPDEP
jgi:hypothetical protein